MFTMYPLANYANLLNSLQTIFSDIMGDAPVPPNFITFNTYSHEGLGLFLQRLPDKFAKETPYGVLTITQHPVADENQSISLKFLRELVTMYFGYEKNMLGTFSPVIYDGSNFFLKPIYHRVLGTVQLSMIVPSQALAYEYSRYLQAVFQINKWISFRDLLFYHNIWLDELVPPLDTDVITELQGAAVTRVDTISNRSLLTFTGTNWYMLKLDSIDITSENVPFEGDQVFWILEANFSLMTNEVVYYQLNYKFDYSITLKPFESIRTWVTNTDLVTLTTFYEGGDDVVSVLVTHDDKTYKATTPVLIDTTMFDPATSFPMQVQIKFDKKLLRLFNVPPGYTPSDLEALFVNTLEYIRTGNPVFLPFYNAFTSLNGYAYYIGIVNDRDIICLNCITIDNVTTDPDYIYIDVTVTAPGIWFFAVPVN